MPSPFPGMDPYLEDPATWRDFHGRFVYALSEQLLDRLPSDYLAAVDEQVRLIEVPPEPAPPRPKDILPDVALLHRPGRKPVERFGNGSATAVLEPVVIEIPVTEEIRERRIEVRHHPDHRLVTVIEVLSPTNKNADGEADYRAKRRAIRDQKVNLVEIDLLVGGQRVETAARLPAGDYYVIVSPADRPIQRDVYAWGVRQPLPTVKVPLRKADGFVPVDIAAAFRDAFDRGRYVRRLQYHGPPTAPLADADAAWATQVAATARL